MEEQIKKIYEKQKNGRIRMIRNVLLIYVALICIVSIFKGNPFPHQETVLFFNVKQSGWITTDSYLLWGCAVFDLIVVMLIEICNILREFSKIDRMLSQECDAEKYLEMLEGMIKYGKSLDYKGFQKNVVLMAQPKYIVALIANGELQKAEEYTKNEWKGKQEGRSWQQVVTNLELAKKYQEKDGAGYSDTLEKAGNVFQNNPLFMAKKFMLKEEDEAAIRLLEDDTEKLPYYEVTRRLLLGVCYYRVGKEQQGKECMEYVIAHGNTLDCKKEAKKYIGM